MALVKEYFYNLQCDKCGGLYNPEMWHDDADEIEDFAENDGWHIIGNKHYCPDCHEDDDEDNI